MSWQRICSGLNLIRQEKFPNTAIFLYPTKCITYLNEPEHPQKMLEKGEKFSAPWVRNHPRGNFLSVTMHWNCPDDIRLHQKYCNVKDRQRKKRFCFLWAFSHLNSRWLSTDFAMIPLFAVGEILLIRSLNLLHCTDVRATMGKIW